MTVPRMSAAARVRPSGLNATEAIAPALIVQLCGQAVAAHVPQLDRAAGARGRDDAPIRTERDAADRAGVTGQTRGDPGRNRTRKRSTTTPEPS
jgi:hypothetical protein